MMSEKEAEAKKAFYRSFTNTTLITTQFYLKRDIEDHEKMLREAKERMVFVEIEIECREQNDTL